MGFKTIKFEEFDHRVAEYWHPDDLDLPEQRALIDQIAANWKDGKGFLRLVFDDEHFVLTQIDHRLENGLYQELWATGENPAEVAGRQRAAAAVAELPQTFEEMWTTYGGWDRYLEYAAATFKTESTDFLVAVEEYRQSPSIPAQLAVYERFIVDSAPQQVNIDNDLVQAIEAAELGSPDVFDAAQRYVYDLLATDYTLGFLAWVRRNA